MASVAIDPTADDWVPECQQLNLFPLHPKHLLLQDRDPRSKPPIWLGFVRMEKWRKNGLHRSEKKKT
ncbi:hypothetical protein COCNU_10G008690 [Cocos nucifera]|uniref:Uncharacterized protein n=1 Tax=Cocos nucifera TaxID=13894 RepID=A0A8K0N815_COCNU|nr:hypothetical protein COCNU_10G008690 [Cocos nucifera]